MCFAAQCVLGSRHANQTAVLSGQPGRHATSELRQMLVLVKLSDDSRRSSLRTPSNAEFNAHTDTDNSLVGFAKGVDRGGGVGYLSCMLATA